MGKYMDACMLYLEEGSKKRLPRNLCQLVWYLIKHQVSENMVYATPGNLNIVISIPGLEEVKDPVARKPIEKPV